MQEVGRARHERAGWNGLKQGQANQPQHDQEPEHREDLFLGCREREGHGSGRERGRAVRQSPRNCRRLKTSARSGSWAKSDQGRLLEMRTKSWSPSCVKPYCQAILSNAEAE